MTMETYDYKYIKYEKNNRVGIITINRPDKLNSLSNAVLRELEELLIKIDEGHDFETSGLILTGSGEKAFISGADVKEMSKMSVSEASDYSKLGQRVCSLFEHMPMPVIAAVNGYAFGGGLELAMSSDFIISTANSVFAMPEVGLGLIPGFGGTQRLSRLIGANRAKRLIYTGDRIDVELAVDMGLILEVFDTREDMLDAAIELIKSIEKNSPVAVAVAKKVINEGMDCSIDDGLALELENFTNLFTTDDMREGTLAFLEKRAPNFRE